MPDFDLFFPGLCGPGEAGHPPRWFSDQKADNPGRAIAYEIEDYLELVDWSGRAVIEGKRGSIPDNLPPILERLKIDPASYVKFINRSEKTRFGNFVGPREAIRDLAERFGKSLLSPSCSPLGRSEGLTGPVARVFCDRAKRPGRGAWWHRSRRRGG